MKDRIVYYRSPKRGGGQYVSPRHMKGDLADRALRAFAAIVDDCATLDDLTAFRAWATHLRLTGSSEDEVASTVLVADDLARKLGVA